MPLTRLQSKLALIQLLLPLQGLAVQDAHNGVLLEGQFIPQEIFDDVKLHQEDGEVEMDKRQVPGARCRQDQLLAVAQSQPYWTGFCSGYIGAPQTTVTSTAFPTS